MTSYGSCPINAIHKAIQLLCVGWNPIKSFLSESPRRASWWARSGNNHKCQISCVSISKAETRQEHENLHAQPFNWTQRKKTFQWPPGRKSNPFPWSARFSQIILTQCKRQKKFFDPFIYTHYEMINFHPTVQSYAQKKQNQEEISNFLWIHHFTQPIPYGVCLEISKL